MLCSRCNIDQPRDQFGPNADMWPLRRECKRCGRHKAQLRKHGLHAADRQRIADAQGGCRICGHGDPGTKGWVVDHDHDCCPGESSCPNCRRGVLCSYCNHLLGNAFDRPQILRAAAAYLERPRDCSWHFPVAHAPSICGERATADATDSTDRTELTEMSSPEMNPSPNASRAGGLKDSSDSAARWAS